MSSFSFWLSFSAAHLGDTASALPCPPAGSFLSQGGSLQGMVTREEEREWQESTKESSVVEIQREPLLKTCPCCWGCFLWVLMVAGLRLLSHSLVSKGAWFLDPADVKVPGCTSPLYKVMWYLHRTYTHHLTLPSLIHCKCYVDNCCTIFFREHREKSIRVLYRCNFGGEFFSCEVYIHTRCMRLLEL